jgi:CHAD domain-containing protein
MQPDTQTGTFASTSVSRLVERLAYRVNATAHAHDERTVHDLRVAIRRFTQSLSVFKHVFGGKDVKKLRRRLKDLMDLTNEVRDCDVALSLLSKSELPSAAALNQKLRERRKEGMRMLLPALQRWTARKTTSKWRAALTPNGTSHLPLADTVRDRLPRIAKKFVKDGDRAGSSSQLHHVRIDAKKLRYSLELLQPVYGAEFTGAIERVKSVQTVLGQINDCHAVRLLAGDLGADAEIASWLKKRQRKKTREFRKLWPVTATALRDFAKTLKQQPRTQRKPMGRVAQTAAPSRTRSA